MSRPARRNVDGICICPLGIEIYDPLFPLLFPHTYVDFTMKPIFVSLLTAVLVLATMWCLQVSQQLPQIMKNSQEEETRSTGQSLPNRTTINVTETPPYLFTCQDDNNGNNQFRSVLKDVLPEYVQQDMRQFGSNRKRLGLQLKKLREQYANTHDYDLFQLTDGGFCTDIVEHWMRHLFRGKVVLFNGEELNVQDNSSMPLLRDFVYYLGPLPEGYHPHSLRLYYLQFVWWHELYKQGHDELIDPQRKPRNTGKNFLIYSQANCVPFREEAYDALSRLGEVHHGGRCNGKLQSKNKTKVDTGVTLSNWLDNIKSYRDYRFCLVMEHGTSEGYVTEKILVAFQAGCVPIYYGTRSIFDLFNENAFIFYDIHNNTAALERIVELESNRTKYEQTMNEPILAHGNQTVEKYFSFSEAVGGGKLKQRIRRLLGLDDRIDFVT